MREVNEALLISSIHQHELTEQSRMYHAKSSGRNNHRLFTPNMHAGPLVRQPH